MKKLAIVLLATTTLATPTAFAASHNQQPSQGQQMQNNQKQGQKQGAPTGQNAQDQQSQQSGQQQAAQNNQPISPERLSRGEIRQVQQALDKGGFNAGPTDGRWGRETENAVK